MSLRVNRTDTFAGSPLSEAEIDENVNKMTYLFLPWLKKEAGRNTDWFHRHSSFPKV